MKDLTGQRFGRLVVIEATEARRRGSVVWRCQCDCGNQCEVASSELAHGKTKSCGCLKRDARRLDLAGQRFGRLVAVRPTDKRRASSVVWHCQCDCGNTCEVASSSLTSGNTRSCGCMKGGEGERRVRLDLTGRRFGKLVAVRPVGRKNGSVVWECQCDCGNTKEAVSHHLTSGKVRSCGCLMSERATRPGQTIDLTGQRFGDLVVVKRSGTRDHYALWECQCSCGAKHLATSRELRSGRVTSCGGPQHAVEEPPAVDIIVPSRRFGKLTVVSKTDEVIDGSPVWRCLCDCDRTRHCTERELLEGIVTSCGECTD